MPAELHLLVHEPEEPQAATVVIVHGAMDRAGSFGRVTRHLQDLRVVRYDRRGYGRSRALGVATFEQHVADLLDVVGQRRATVFGHSIGGVIALAAAARAPERVASLLLYEPPMPWAPWWPRPAAPAEPATAEDEAEAFMRRAIGDRYWERLPARTRADRRAEGGALRADVASVQQAPVDVASVLQPTLVAAGGEASWWHERAARELAGSMPAAELTVVAGAGHGAHLTHPTATAGLVRRALARR